MFLLLLSIFCFFLSCRSRINPSEDQVLLDMTQSDPDQAVRRIDSLLHRNPKTSLTDERQLQLRQWRQAAFEKLGNADSVFEEALRIQSLARHLDDSMAYARALLPVKGDIEESKFKYLEDVYPVAIGLFSRREMYREQLKLMSTEAAMLNNMGNFEASQQLAMQAIALPGRKEQDTLTAALYQTIANNFMGMNTNDRSFDYFRRALHIARNLQDSMLQSNILLDLGILHYDVGTDSARAYYLQAIDVLPKERGKLQRIKILYNISVEDFQDDRNAEALAGFRHLLAVSQRDKMPTAEAVALKALGFYHEAKGSPDSAVYFLQRSIQLADSIGQPFLKIQGMIELAKAYRTAGQEEKSFALHLETDDIRDSMFSVDKKNVIHGLEMRFDTERSALEIDNLRQHLFIRKGWIIFLSLFSLVSVALVWLVRQRSHLWKSRYHAYAVLMEKYKAERKSKDANEEDKASPVEAPVRTAQSVKRSNKAQSNPTYVEIQHLFKSKAVYKDPKLRIEDVADWLNVSPRQISAALKEREGVTFNQYVNNHRINEARRIMEDPATSSLKLEVLAEMVGIPNRTYFQKVFESIVGVTPGFYRRNISLNEGDSAGTTSDEG
jgi:AraC-like DNA-binding protein